MKQAWESSDNIEKYEKARIIFFKYASHQFLHDKLSVGQEVK